MSFGLPACRASEPQYMRFEVARAASPQTFEVTRVASLQVSEPHHHCVLPARRALKRRGRPVRGASEPKYEF